MRYLLIAVALFAAGCGSSPTSPAPVYHASLTATNPIVGTCQDVRCTYTATITNTGPDCVAGVGMSISVTEAPLFPVLGVGASFAGVLRPNQAVTVSGADWPRNAILVTSAAAVGQPIACP